MKNLKLNLAVMLAGIVGVTAAIADYDGSDSLVCSLGRILECDNGSMCRTVSNESIDAPDFVKLNFKKKEFAGVTAGQDSAPGTIGNVVNFDNHLVVQGVQGSSSEARDALGWSMSINQSTGRMVLTGSGDDAGFVVFGACTPD